PRCAVSASSFPLPLSEDARGGQKFAAVTRAREHRPDPEEKPFADPLGAGYALALSLILPSLDNFWRKDTPIISHSQSLLALAVLVLTCGPVSPTQAADTPSGAIALHSTSVAAGVGVQWGDGILTYQGQTYPFSVQGLEVVGLGYAEITAEGTVYNLTRLE